MLWYSETYREWRDVTHLGKVDLHLLLLCSVSLCCSLYQILKANVTTMEFVLLTFSADFCN